MTALLASSPFMSFRNFTCQSQVFRQKKGYWLKQILDKELQTIIFVKFLEGEQRKSKCLCNKLSSDLTFGMYFSLNGTQNVLIKIIEIAATDLLLCTSSAPTKLILRLFPSVLIMYGFKKRWKEKQQQMCKIPSRIIFVTAAFICMKGIARFQNLSTLDTQN